MKFVLKLIVPFALFLAIPFTVYGIVCAHLFIDNWVTQVPVLILVYFALFVFFVLNAGIVVSLERDMSSRTSIKSVIELE